MTSSTLNHRSPQPGVSVVIPCYNYAHFVGNAIDSALGQDYSPLEIIVVDDGSTDRTREVVQSYGDRVRYLHKTNAGLSAARNTGISAARFSYLAFLDADDEWSPSMLQSAMEAFERLPKEFALVACRSVFVDEAGHFLEAKQLEKCAPREITVEDLLLKTRFQPSGVVVKRSAFEDCGNFDVTLRSSEDRDMWIRIAISNRLHLLGESLVRFRNHPSSMSKHADRMNENIRRVLAKTRRNSGSLQFSWHVWRRAYSFHDYQTAWMYRDEGRYTRAIWDLIKSMLKFPFFLDPHALNENYFYRIRSLLQFSREALLCSHRRCQRGEGGASKETTSNVGIK